VEGELQHKLAPHADQQLAHAVQLAEGALLRLDLRRPTQRVQPCSEFLAQGAFTGRDVGWEGEGGVTLTREALVQLQDDLPRPGLHALDDPRPLQLCVA
jgi:hypothetical protein